MKQHHLTELDLSKQLGEFRDRYPKLANDQLFMAWFLRAFLAENDEEAVDALCGGANDKCTDGVFIDDSARTVFIVQGKYRKGLEQKAEKRNDLLGFAQLALHLTSDKHAFQENLKSSSAEVLHRLSEARKRIVDRDYRLRLFFVTTGKCSPTAIADAESLVRKTDADAAIEVIGGKRLLVILTDYVDGVAPPVPSLDLQIEARGGNATGVLQRFDPDTEIESWVFCMNAKDVGAIFDRAGVRLFARNIRGFLGSTPINRGMEATLSKEPEYFWYYNNGITVICDDARRESSQGRDLLRVTNPQVINGQQTTRTLARNASKAGKASVLVKVIRVPRTRTFDGKSHRFESLVSQIVSATNWQNAIRPSDLMSNDRRQIEIEREMRKQNYWYVRKRQTKGEARRLAGSQKYTLLRKEEIAQAVAACELESSVVREGKEGLFEERYYTRVFPGSDPWFYLARYRLMREVSYMAHGIPSRAYPKWLVLHFVWQRLRPLVANRSSIKKFVEISEADRSPVTPLWAAVGLVFKASLRFYRLKRKGIGQKAQDVSTFFKGRALDAEFEAWWRSTHNKDRQPFEKRWKAFEIAFKADAAN